MAERAKPTEEQRFNPELQTPLWRRKLKASEAGRLGAALYRRRRAPRQILNAPGGRKAERIGAPAERRRVRAVVWMPAGPGDRDVLLDTYASAHASSPGEVALLVTDDWTPDATRAAIQAVVPDAVVVRPRIPSGGPPRMWPVTKLALHAALTHFEFDYLIKLDTDAIVVGPDWISVIDEAVQAAAGPRPVGIAGTFRDRPDGEQETDAPYHRKVLAGELPHDAKLADWHGRALVGGWPEGNIVQGGCLVLTRALCDAIAAEGGVTYTPRLRTIVSEDLLLTVLAYATGFQAGSLGGPAGPFAIANKHLPLPLDELVDPASRWRVTHSTKVGIDGEPEAEVRERARAARADWPARTPAA